MKALILLIPFLFVSCATKPEKPEKTPISTVLIPEVIDPPSVGPIRDSLNDLGEKVKDVESQVEDASASASDTNSAISELRKILEKELEASKANSQETIDKIKKAAELSENKITETEAKLQKALTTIQSTEANTEKLRSEISLLQSEISVQSSQINQLTIAANTANKRLTIALNERGNFSDALERSNMDLAVYESDNKRLKKHRFALIIGISFLVVTSCGLSYLLFKP